MNKSIKAKLIYAVIFLKVFLNVNKLYISDMNFIGISSPWYPLARPNFFHIYIYNSSSQHGVANGKRSVKEKEILAQ